MATLNAQTGIASTADSNAANNTEGVLPRARGSVGKHRGLATNCTDSSVGRQRERENADVSDGGARCSTLAGVTIPAIATTTRAISTAAVAVVGQAWRWPFVILAGAAATLMAIRPLGSVRLLRKIMVWLVLAASVYLFVQVLMQPRQAIPQESVLGFWPAVDLAVAGVVSFAPLAADYSRHSQTRKAAFWGASAGYGLAAVAYYALGVFAVLNLGASDVITALVTLPAGAIAIAILLVDEVDASKFSTSAPSRCAASVKLMRVRVDGSKNSVHTAMPSSARRP